PHNAPADLFTVRTTHPSYWQLTTLDEFSGSSWAPGQVTYVGIGSQLPGTRAPGPGRQRETFTVQSLGSPWLPTGLDPLAIHSATPDLQYSARTGSILSPRSTSDGLHYTVTSSRALLHLTTADLAALPRLQRNQAPPRSLQLPTDLPRSVGRLARRITAGAHTEVAEALALQAYFHGARFHYSLHPPIDGSGVEALTGFLFVTHTGYCQQFAASFAALARSVGLPTRLAVGFTTGTPIGHHTYEVTDADVHTWPEVWFPKVGWVPFEPTKGSGRSAFAIPGAPWTGAGGGGTPALVTAGTGGVGAARG
ncbi:hypothetical protein GHK86_19205, partial [Acidimicrobiaceae bacterium USS-CC1]|nr:hypothetical protein [Acidiferrimicrobium australe]